MAHNNLAVALYFHGDFDEAAQEMEKAEQLGYPVDERFKAALNEKLKG